MGLNVRNMTKSMDFYGKVIGMRHIITIQVVGTAPAFRLAQSCFGRRTTATHIKLFHFADPENPLVATTERTNTFANIGLVVPDVQAAQSRFEKHGVKIIKAQVDAVIKGLLTTDFEYILFVEDPDGNMLEVVKQDGFWGAA
ncbi:uncharacterized protein Z518_04807 [Rhinocladiella mackenziei CBS 650.93]|uniref:VOC domain-containing protein n=1 Tax=Rhinocladiella mackenziei CBS 650.93 TaxID=1442369 RepID=A0A0D2IUJ6_9EURO|nr:uncharacterized protein Z518_04807 [Rhinocladiella mackenziei CBS 650.93]KIX06831.1 hypothetical protein Z518_04807 [Rhinocladiella mackenziei CBS 650.93]